MRAAIALCERELVRFVRQRHRIVGALATPVVFWLLIGAGMNRSFQSEGTGGGGYIVYFFPGTLLMILLFTAIFSTISVIEDRREGFLQGVLVAPVRRGEIVLGKALGATALAVGQGILFLLLGPTVGVKLTVGVIVLTVAMMFIISFALSSLGLAIAWRMTSTQGFHAIMNLFLVPMWFLSGALFPEGGAWGPMRWIMAANPLRYGLAGLRRALYWGMDVGSTVPGMGVSLLVSVAFAGAMFGLALWVASGSSAADVG